jgi:hypothetical protein
MLELLEPET